MAGRIIPSPPAVHVCEGRPNAGTYRAGTRWLCDDCPQVWVVVEGSQYNEVYRTWRRLTPNNSGGRDVF